ncbi:putative hydro-lyase [Staphylococcus succinus]|uniref:putative hydro-lyase n=1 Tax=Staphylococcus succinus TaxID=61015 RepID=UPI00062B6A47|nr:putative hydro-lyase [Staphylococcus succinus]MDH9160739.1 putative hydro-lyase [Staphylococcus succinus]MEB8123555.1 putative hydro-lyase [Staphylococcus succinus]PKI21535.1 putative hydro-lyase [Staphylococcus succinus]PNZ18452.1 putative hydro-lyase [Staphylococcus succinus subsp. succinus]PTI47240.1 putative hydro-lyase [Staphylococcus succinus]
MNLQDQQPHTLRKMISDGQLTDHTSGMAKGFIQANVVILPSKYAYDFLKFCFKNPKTCPLLDVSETGETSFPIYGKEANICTEVAAYRIYRNGELIETTSNISHLFTKDMVSFLIGCSFTFEHALLAAGIPIRHLEEKHNVPMYMTNIPANTSGQFKGNITVSMRPMTMQQAIKATEITTHFNNVHGAPLHIGNPEEIGINNITQPDFGEPVTIKDNEVPVFWGCGVTPQSVALDAKPELMITHAPGHMFITDIHESQLSN